jgi:anti-sigma regulatory factor (Ser/Thr protein kinase)
VSSAAAAGFALPWPGLARGPAGDEPGSVFRLELTAVPAAAQVARDRARIVLAEWNVSPDDAGTAVLLISELVANAVKFGTAPRAAAPAQVSLALAHAPGLLAIGVSGQSAGLPVRRPAGPDAESGRGLNMVGELSSQWGFFFPGPPGWKTVYCLISLQAGQEQEGELPA